MIKYIVTFTLALLAATLLIFNEILPMDLKALCVLVLFCITMYVVARFINIDIDNEDQDDEASK